MKMVMVEIKERHSSAVVGTIEEIIVSLKARYPALQDYALSSISEIDDLLQMGHIQEIDGKALGDYSLPGVLIYKNLSDARAAYDNDARWDWRGGARTRNALRWALEKVDA